MKILRGIAGPLSGTCVLNPERTLARAVYIYSRVRLGRFKAMHTIPTIACCSPNNRFASVLFDYETVGGSALPLHDILTGVFGLVCYDEKRTASALGGGSTVCFFSLPYKTEQNKVVLGNVVSPATDISPFRDAGGGELPRAIL